MMSTSFQIDRLDAAQVFRLVSQDGTNRLTRDCVLRLTAALGEMGQCQFPLIITGNKRFFSVGAELSEIAALNGPEGHAFSKMGQALMNTIERFPAAVYAAIDGYWMGGGLDLALACHHHIASSHAVFGHRGAALGLITGWGGTQRLARLVGKAKTLEMFIAAEKLHAAQALRIGLVDIVATDPLAKAQQWIRQRAREDREALRLG
jgi:enoyl-CoA hydratase